MDVTEHNRRAWDHQVEIGNPWSRPVDAETIARARRGDFQIHLTNERPVPRDWFPDLAGARVLCLASSGGQQAPILAAAGARVTAVDLSPRQLAQDRLVAAREGLRIDTIQGDMRDLGMIRDGSFDLVVHACSNSFVPDVRPVWREAFRVLREGGVLLAGFVNPAAYIFDLEAAEKDGVVRVRHELPYSDLTSLTPAERDDLIARGEPFLHSHSLEEQIGGQIEAGFVLAGLYEDRWPEMAFSRHLPTMIATRAVKPVR